MSDLNSTLNNVTNEIVQGIAAKAKFYDILERVTWTLLQVLSGELIRSFANSMFTRYNVLYGDHVMQLGVEWIILFTFVITIAKNVIASHLGNGSASAGIPQVYEPVLPGTPAAETIPTPVVEPEPTPAELS